MAEGRGDVAAGPDERAEQLLVGAQPRLLRGLRATGRGAGRRRSRGGRSAPRASPGACGPRAPRPWSCPAATWASTGVPPRTAPTTSPASARTSRMRTSAHRPEGRSTWRAAPVSSSRTLAVSRSCRDCWSGGASACTPRPTQRSSPAAASTHGTPSARSAAVASCIASTRWCRARSSCPATLLREHPGQGQRRAALLGGMGHDDDRRAVAAAGHRRGRVAQDPPRGVQVLRPLDEHGAAGLPGERGGGRPDRALVVAVPRDPPRGVEQLGGRGVGVVAQAQRAVVGDQAHRAAGVGVLRGEGAQDGVGRGEQGSAVVVADERGGRAVRAAAALPGGEHLGAHLVGHQRRPPAAQEPRPGGVEIPLPHHLRTVGRSGGGAPPPKGVTEWRRARVPPRS